MCRAKASASASSSPAPTRPRSRSLLLPLPTLQWGEGRGEGQTRAPALLAARHPDPPREVRGEGTSSCLDAQGGLEPALDLLDIGRIAVAQRALAVLGCGERQHVGT